MFRLNTAVGPERLAFNAILSGTPAFTAALHGMILYAQWLVLDPSPQSLVASSNALYIALN